MFCGVHLRTISLVLVNWISNMCSEITHLNLLPHVPGANELNVMVFQAAAAAGGVARRPNNSPMSKPPVGAQAPTSAREAHRRQQEQDYLQRLKQIRLQNFNERRNLRENMQQRANAKYKVRNLPVLNVCCCVLFSLSLIWISVVFSDAKTSVPAMKCCVHQPINCHGSPKWLQNQLT